MSNSRTALIRTGCRLFATLLIVLACITSVLPTWPAQALADDQAEYALGPGDRIRVTVFNQPDLSGEFEVDGSGSVSLPLIRDVQAQGLTVNQLEEKIIGKLSPDYVKDPRVSVEVLNYRPFYIFGEVNNPGSYPFVSGMTVVNAIAMAGGFSYRARTNEVKIVRANDPTRTPKTADRDTRVLPGDVIEVPERFF